MPALRGKRRIAVTLGALAGALAAAMPAVAMADEGRRELATPTDLGEAMVFLVLGLAAVIVAASVLFLYRRQRNLHWDYQLPEGALSEADFTDADADGDEHH